MLLFVLEALSICFKLVELSKVADWKVGCWIEDWLFMEA